MAQPVQDPIATSDAAVNASSAPVGCPPFARFRASLYVGSMWTWSSLNRIAVRGNANATLPGAVGRRSAAVGVQRQSMHDNSQNSKGNPLKLCGSFVQNCLTRISTVRIPSWRPGDWRTREAWVPMLFLIPL